MGRFLVTAVLNGIALWITALLVPSVTVVPFNGDPTWSALGTYFALGVFLGIINALLMPIVRFLTLPLYLVTLGLWSFVVNGFALWVLKLLSDALGWGVMIPQFWWTAIWAALVLGIVNWLIGSAARALGIGR